MEEFARLAVLLIAAALIIRFISGGFDGPDGVKAWLGAKFLGRAG